MINTSTHKKYVQVCLSEGSHSHPYKHRLMMISLQPLLVSFGSKNTHTLTKQSSVHHACKHDCMFEALVLSVCVSWLHEILHPSQGMPK